ncbi:hypothetical protein [Terrisporobacter mayombei]|uniref:Lj928 prophage protein n=1 Tax=Terrisporobacter mayombei TaxID=1541 RepID=A0ABY9PX15_9FIRM|nr:hypothetical protein [Terrisporobacter mayombei]MCC3870280.1 hypothetical protein [Terrisporobacter mayombei]WMT79906.1 hypothetical protein TEMA_01770 [Terrisporobacter mayombei]
MTNTIAYATLFQQALDKAAVAKLTSGWMDANAGQVIYNGGKEVKIPKMNMDGLGDYSRSNGFTQGSITLEYETKTMTQDRGRTFMLDSMDVDESNFVANATNAMGQFQATKVVPEIDAYRYSKIASLAIAGKVANGGNTIDETNVLKLLKADITAIEDIVGDIPLVITMSTPISAILDDNEKISKRLDVTEFTKGDIITKVKSFDGHPIVKVPSARMKTTYTFYDGKTSGQTAGGFVAADEAKNINWIITPMYAPIAVNKTDKIRIFDPNVNQDADAWKLDYRKYHDLWIMDEALKICRVNIKEALV